MFVGKVESWMNYNHFTKLKWSHLGWFLWRKPSFTVTSWWGRGLNLSRSSHLIFQYVFSHLMRGRDETIPLSIIYLWYMYILYLYYHIYIIYIYNTYIWGFPSSSRHDQIRGEGQSEMGESPPAIPFWDDSCIQPTAIRIYIIYISSIYLSIYLYRYRYRDRYKYICICK